MMPDRTLRLSGVLSLHHSRVLTVRVLSASDEAGHMIVPILDEAGWNPRLAGLPRWQPPHRPTIVISPHPDDETLGTGGLISELRFWGIEVTIVAVTDGENASSLPACPKASLAWASR